MNICCTFYSSVNKQTRRQKAGRSLQQKVNPSFSWIFTSYFYQFSSFAIISWKYAIYSEASIPRMPNREVLSGVFPTAMNEIVNLLFSTLLTKVFQSLGHRDKMRVVGWHTAIRGLVTTCYAYVEGASVN